MKIITRYVLRHFLPIFGLALSSFVGLYLVIDFFEKVDDLLEKQVSLIDTLSYFLYKIPFIITQGIPMAVLLAALIGLGILKRNREIVALKAAGVGVWIFTGPIVAAALLLALGDFFLGETLARTLNLKAQRIWADKIVHRQTSVYWAHENLWYHGHDAIYQVRLYDRSQESLEKVSIFFLDPQFRMIQRVDARRLRWGTRGWVAEQVLTLGFNGTQMEQNRFDELRLNLRETPQDFSRLESIPEELGFFELYRYVRKVRQEGYRTTPYEVELQLRAAFPLTTIVLALLGIVVALRQGLHGGIALGVTIALIAAFIYLAVLQIGCSLATAGLVPPVLGVWAANLIFSALATYLWIMDNR